MQADHTLPRVWFWYSGGEFAFYFRQGTENKLVVEFEGGGGCWDVVTCLIPSIYKVEVEPERAMTDRDYNYNVLRGIHDFEDQRNPVRDWSFLYIPYCTAGVHAGNTTGPLGIEMRGRLNTRAALDFAFGRVRTPETTLTTGCSAGALGSVLWAGTIMSHYRDSRNLHMADCFVGETLEKQWKDTVALWAFGDVFPPGIAGLTNAELADCGEGSRRPCSDSAVYIMDQISSALPNAVFSHYTSNADSVQVAFYGQQLPLRCLFEWERTLVGEIPSQKRANPIQLFACPSPLQASPAAHSPSGPLPCGATFSKWHGKPTLVTS